MSTDVWLRRQRVLTTEQEWREWEFIDPLLRFFRDRPAGARRPRLFTAACMRRMWGTPYLQPYHGAIEALERQADGLLPPGEEQALALALREARLRCTEVMGGMYWQMSIDYQEAPETDPWRSMLGTGGAMLVAAGRLALVSSGQPDDRPEPHLWAAEERAQCALFRCVFGNPFRPAGFDSAWRSPTLAGLAQAVYDHRALPSGHLDPARLAVLSDALEEAGCADERLLSHLREPGPHAPGCWPVELVLNRE